jgi:CRP-like cAMP-binding protein
MLRQLSIHDRSPHDLRQLALERRELAEAKTGSIRALLLKEARLLEFQADLRIWAEQPSLEARTDGRRNLGPAHLPSIPYELAPLVVKLSSRMGLAAADQQALLAAASPPRFVQKGECLIEQGEDVAALMILCNGMTQTVRTLSDGRQQIVAVSVAGDVLNSGGLLFRQARNSIFALTPAICLSLPFKLVETVTIAHPAIARALWLETAAQAAIQEEWMVWLGRRAAQTRLAHFLCEVTYRMQLSGNGVGDEFEFPLTQRELGDLLGLSSVHVNRTLQILRNQGLIELNRQRLKLRNRSGLYEIAEFDPRYLDGLRLSVHGAA